jgi:hypothetical protein
MSSASVKSFEAIERVRGEVLKFASRSIDGLTELNGQVRRTIDWIEHDRPDYWKDRTRRAFDAVGTAKGELHRCLMYPINDQQPSCTEQRAALKKAEAHYQWCLERQERTRYWSQSLRHELEEYKGRVAKLVELSEVRFPQAAAQLGRLLAALDAYAVLAPPGRSAESGAVAGSPSAPSADATPDATLPAPPSETEEPEK